MKMSLRDVRRVVDDVAKKSRPSARVLSASNGEGASDYVEVTLASQDDRFVVGLSRDGSEEEIRRAVHDQLRNRPADRGSR